MKKIPLVSNGKTPLVWNDYKYGGQYAGYKLGTIIRWKVKNKFRYNVHTSYHQVYNAVSLVDAKQQLDAYTREQIAQYEKERKSSIKKKR